MDIRSCPIVYPLSVPFTTPGVQHLVLFHHDPSYNDDLIRINEAQIRSVYPNVTAAYEGLEITIAGDQTATIALPNKHDVAAV